MGVERNVSHHLKLELESLESRRLMAAVWNPIADQAIFVEDPFTLDASFFNDDLQRNHSVTVDWGDGTPVTGLADQEEVSGRRGPLKVTIDYRYDDNNFFDTQLKRDLMQYAADELIGRFADSLAAISPFGSNSWTASFFHPSLDTTARVRGLQVDANEIIVFAGGTDLRGNLAEGGPGGFSAQGTRNWLATVSTRGESGAAGNATDFGPWGGSISFDHASTDWYFGFDTAGLQRGQADFFSVAMHEMGHVLGFGIADSWDNRVSNGRFSGPAVDAEYDLDGSPSVTNDGHWAEDVRDEGQETAMDPTIRLGTRKAFTPLDFAAFDDIGWQLLDPLGISGRVVASHQYTQPGDYDVTVTVTDDLGVATESTLRLTAVYDTRATIGQVVFLDQNGNGLQDKRETGLPGATLEIAADQNGNGQVDAGEPILNELQSNENGFFDFGSLTAGSYVVRVTDVPGGPASLIPTTALTVAVDLDRAEDFNDLAFGLLDADQLLFGQVDGRSNMSLEYQGVVYRLNGPGTGQLLLGDDGLSLRFSDTTDRSRARIVVPKAQEHEIRSVTIEDGGLRQLNMRHSDLVGLLTAPDGLGTLQVKDLQQAGIVVGPSTDQRLRFTLKAADITDTTIDSAMPIKSFRFDQWLDQDQVADQINASSAGVIHSGGLFQADVTLSDDTVRWTLNRLLAGDVSDSVIRTAGSINTIRAQSLTNSRIFAGMDPALQTLPDNAAGFVNPDAMINRIQLRSRDNGPNFSDSTLSAPVIQMASLGRVAVENGDEFFGVAADQMRVLRLDDGNGSYIERNLKAPLGQQIELDDFLVRLVDLS